MVNHLKLSQAQKPCQPFHSLLTNQHRVDPKHWQLCQIPSCRSAKILPGQSIERSIHHMLLEQQPDQDQQAALSIVLSHASQNPSHTRIVGTGAVMGWVGALAPSFSSPPPWLIVYAGFGTFTLNRSSATCTYIGV